MVTGYQIHQFIAYPDRGNGEPVKKSCVKCGRMQTHWLHHLWEAVQRYKDDG